MEEEYYLPFESETYTAHATSNVDFDTDILRYAYQSMATPASIIDFNMKTREKVIRKEQEVLGGSFKDNYIEERVWATAKDGTQVPISMVYKRSDKDGKPILLYAYGSYGHSMDAYFHQQDYPYSTEVLFMPLHILR
jgi:oligopeptidase B